MKGVKVAGKELKRERTKSGKTEVNGHAVFEKGNLVKPKTTTDKLLEMQVKKAKQKVTKNKVEDLPDEDEQWIQYLTINNVKNQEKREEIKAMISKVIKLPDVKWSKVNDADFVAKTNNRIILKICALSKPATWSAMCPSLGPSISRYTFEEVMEAIPKAHEMFHKVAVTKAKPKTQLPDDEALELLDSRLQLFEKSGNSKAFKKPKTVKITKAVEQWALDNNLKITLDEFRPFQID